MRLAVFSDIHDDIDNLNLALTKAVKADCSIFCGDLCSPFVVKHIGERLQHTVHMVFGNNDGDLFRITKIASKYSNLTLHGEYAQLDLLGKKIALNHFDNIAYGLAKGGYFDYCIFGHNHCYQFEKTAENTTLLNPGAVYGGAKESTMAILDLASGSVSKIVLR